MDAPPPTRDSVLAELEQMLGSSIFHGAERSKALLRFLVAQTLDNRADRLKEYTLGVEALGKDQSFDPRSDPIVRAEASRLRGRLDRYHVGEGAAHPIAIELPRGSYVPQFRHRAQSEPDAVGLGGQAMPSPSVQRDRRIWLVAGVAAVAVSIAWWVAVRAPAALDRHLMQFEVELTSTGVVGSEVGPDMVLSSDGTRIVFVARGGDGVARLHTRRLAEPTVNELPGTEGARGPFLSPDGQWVGFWASGHLKKTALAGGSPLVLCDAVDLLGGSWGEDGNIIAALSFGRLARVVGASGQSTVIADLAAESIDPRWPQVMPGARQVLFTAVGPQGPNAANIEALSLTDGTRKVLVRGGTYGRYLPNGHLIYVNQGTLYAVRFDLARMEISPGTPTPLIDDVLYSFTFGFAQLDVSRAGTLVYRRSAARGQLVAKWIDETGNIEPLLTMPGQYTAPTSSRGGRRLAFAVTEGGTPSVRIHELRPEGVTRTQTLPGFFLPLWSPDGRDLVLGGNSGLSALRVDQGVTQPRPLTRTRALQVPWSFAPDGSRLAYHELNPTTGFDLWTIPIRDTKDGLTAGEPEVFLQTASYETYPTFSPDGRWVAYGSGAYGKWEVYVRPFPASGATPVQVSQGGGRIPRWLPNSHDLLYRTDDQRLMVAAYTVSGGVFIVEKPRPWWPGQLADTGVLANFDVDWNGRRVLALVPASDAGRGQSPNHVTVTLNFSDEVRRRVDEFRR